MDERSIQLLQATRAMAACIVDETNGTAALDAIIWLSQQDAVLHAFVVQMCTRPGHSWSWALEHAEDTIRKDGRTVLEICTSCWGSLQVERIRNPGGR